MLRWSLHRPQTNFFAVNKINFGEWHYQIDFLTESRLSLLWSQPISMKFFYPLITDMHLKDKKNSNLIGFFLKSNKAGARFTLDQYLFFYTKGCNDTVVGQFLLAITFKQNK